MQIPSEGERFDQAAHTGLFVSFTRGGGGVRGISIDPALRKRPTPGAGTDQKKFDLAVQLPAITDGSNHCAHFGSPAQVILP
jgi:hypothetical protein